MKKFLRRLFRLSPRRMVVSAAIMALFPTPTAAQVAQPVTVAATAAAPKPAAPKPVAAPASTTIKFRATQKLPTAFVEQVTLPEFVDIIELTAPAVYNPKAKKAKPAKVEKAIEVPAVAEAPRPSRNKKLKIVENPKASSDDKIAFQIASGICGNTIADFLADQQVGPNGVDRTVIMFTSNGRMALAPAFYTGNDIHFAVPRVGFPYMSAVTGNRIDNTLSEPLAKAGKALLPIAQTLDAKCFAHFDGKMSDNSVRFIVRMPDNTVGAALPMPGDLAALRPTTTSIVGDSNPGAPQKLALR